MKIGLRCDTVRGVLERLFLWFCPVAMAILASSWHLRMPSGGGVEYEVVLTMCPPLDQTLLHAPMLSCLSC